MVNNWFSDFVSPERSDKNNKVNRSMKVDFSSFKPNKRASHGSPAYFKKPKQSIPGKRINFTVTSSLTAHESCENPSDKGSSDITPKYDIERNVVTKFAFATRVGYMPNNPKKVNQDAFILAPNILNLKSMHYFGV